MDSSSDSVTRLLAASARGDRAALDALMPHLYRELRRIAAHYMAGERADHTLQPTALVSEAYLRLVDQQSIQWNSRAQFFSIAAQVMRHVLVDHARARNAEKRGGRRALVTLDENVAAAEPHEVDLLALDEALRALEALDPARSRLVELRYFGGLSIEDTAEALGVSTATVKRDWAVARAWLFKLLGGTAP